MDVASHPLKNQFDATVDGLVEAERRDRHRKFTEVHSYHIQTQRKDEATQIHLLV